MSATSSLVITRTLAASSAQVFAAWTDEETIRQWFCPGPDMIVAVAEVDLREGGRYRVVMQNKDGETYSPSGSYEQIVPNEKLVFSWKWADAELVTRVTVEFRELGPDETEMTLTHEGFPDTDVRDRHNGGWEGCLAKLPGVFRSIQRKEQCNETLL